MGGFVYVNHARKLSAQLTELRMRAEVEFVARREGFLEF